MGRLIDANDLKVHISELMLVYAGCELTNAVLQAIDNAPTVGVEPDCSLKQFGECNYNETGCSDCFIKERIRRALDEKAYMRRKCHE